MGDRPPAFGLQTGPNLDLPIHPIYPVGGSSLKKENPCQA